MATHDTGTSGSGVGARLKVGLLILAIVVVLVLVVQNTQTVSVRVLFWEFTMSRVILILLAAACGFIAGYFVARFNVRRAERRRSTGRPASLG